MYADCIPGTYRGHYHTWITEGINEHGSQETLLHTGGFTTCGLQEPSLHIGDIIWHIQQFFIIHG